MREFKVQFDSKEGRLIDLTILNRYLDEVLSSDFTPKVREDVLKVVETLKFIKVNMPYIEFAVEYKNILPDDIFRNERDKENGVIRDFEGTSLHITNFNSAEEVAHRLGYLVTSFEGALESMRKHNKLKPFTLKIEYDEKTGCIEKRTAAALIYAATTDCDSAPNLDELFQQCCALYPFDNNNYATNRKNTYDFFKDYLGKECIYAGQNQLLTADLIDTYLEMLGQSPEEIKISPEELEQLTKKSSKQLGKSQVKMVQYIFTNKPDADKLVEWLKKQDILQPLSIDKASATLSFDKKQYIVRLTGEQYDALYGEGAYQLLLNPLPNKQPLPSKQRSPAPLPPVQQPPVKQPLVQLLPAQLSPEQELFKEFCQLIKSKQEDQFLERIKKTSEEMINQVFAPSNNEGGLLQIAARHLSEFAFTNLLNEISSDGVNQSLQHKGSTGWTTLQTTARYQSERAFICLLSKADRDTISQDIKLQNEDDATSLQLAARHQSEQAFLSLLIKSKPDDLAEALLLKNKQQESALQTINQYQSEHIYNSLSNISPVIKQITELLDQLCNLAKNEQDDGFLQLLESVSPNFIDIVLTLKNKEGNFLLQIAARYLQNNTFDKLLEKATPDVVSQALFFQNKNKEIALQTAIRYRDSATILTLLGNINQDVLKQAILYSVNDEWTILQLAARHLNEDAFIALLNKISPHVLNKAIILQNDHGRAILPLAIRYQNSAAVQVLLDKISSEAVNKSTPLQDDQGWTLLQLAARYLTGATFATLLTKICPYVLRKTLPHQNSQGWTALQIAATYQGEYAFCFLIEKFNPLVLDDTLFLVNKDGENTLNTITKYQNKKAFDMLFLKLPQLVKDPIVRRARILAEKLSEFALAGKNYEFQEVLANRPNSALSLALMLNLNIHGHGGTTILCKVIQYLNSESFNAFLNRANPNAINAALSIRNDSNSSALKLAGRYLNSHDFIALLEKASPIEVSQALSIKDDDNWNALMTAARCQGENGCMALLNKLPGNIPSAALIKDMLITVCTQQSVKVVALLLKKIDKADLSSLFDQASPLETLIVSIVTIFNETDWEESTSRDITKNIILAAIEKISYATAITELIFTQHYIKGYLLPTAQHAKDLLTRITAKQFSTNKTKALLVSLNTRPILTMSLTDLKIEMRLTDLELESFLNTNIKYIYLPNDALYQLDNINDEDSFVYFIKEIIKHGLATWQDFMNLRQALPSLLEKYSYRGEDVFDFLIKNQLKGTATLHGPLPLRSKLGSDAIQTFSTGHAVVKIINSKKNLNEHTASLKNPAHSRIQNIRQVIPVNSTHKFFHKTGTISPYKKKAPAKGQWTATQKTSVTYISRHLHTKLFGSHHAYQKLVGLAYKAEPALDKAWLTRDRGTYDHGWIGSQSSVQKYADLISNVNHTDYNSFISTIDAHSNTTNEVLSHLTKERLLAVVIGRDTPEERTLARDYAEYIKSELNMELPIIFYDSTHRTVIEYNIRAQREDKLKTIYPNFSFVEEVKAKTNLLTKFSINPPPLISNAIKKAQETEDSGYMASTHTWVETEKNIMALK